MTKFTALTIFLIYFFASALHAQTINVQAGDHGTFTRLVFYVDESITWSINEEMPEIDILFSNFSGKIDHSRVFKPISRNRISNISSHENSIKLQISCTCRYRLSKIFSTYRYIDFFSAPYIKNEFSNESDVIIAKAKNISLSQRNGEVNNISSLPIYDGYPNFSITPDRNNSESETGTISKKPNLWPEPVSSISKSLGQIISHGTLKYSITSGQVNPVKREEIDISNIIMIDPNFHLNQSEINAPKIDCQSFENFSITEWKNSENFNFDTSNLRAQIFSEFDDIDIPIVEDLAKTYIYYSFGAEAFQVLNFLEDAPSNYSLLSELSMIVDGNFEATAPTVSAMRNCSDFFTLLNILIEEDSQNFSEFDIDRALLSLNSLPLHLRKIFGPKFSLILSEAGNDASARSAIISVERGQPDNMSEIDVTKSILDRNSGNYRTTIVTLENMSNEHTQHSLEAAIELTRSLLDQGEEVPEQILDLLTTYAVEYRGTKIEAQVRKSIILASSSMGEHHRAFRELDFFREKFGKNDEYRALSDELLNRLINHHNEASFISSIFNIFPNSDIEITEKYLNALSNRVENYGFGESLEYLWPNSLYLLNLVATEEPLINQNEIELSERKSNKSELVQDNGRDGDFGVDSDNLESSTQPASRVDPVMSEPTIQSANDLLLSSHATRKNISESLF